MDISIKNVTAADYETIDSFFFETRLFHQQARRDIFREPARPVKAREEYESMLADDRTSIFLAVFGDAPAGMIYSIIESLPADTDMTMPAYLKIRDIFVAEEFRGKGVGKALLDKAYGWGKEKGVSHAVLFVWTFNENAIGFYEKMGYRKDSIIMAKKI